MCKQLIIPPPPHLSFLCRVGINRQMLSCADEAIHTINTKLELELRSPWDSDRIPNVVVGVAAQFRFGPARLNFHPERSARIVILVWGTGGSQRRSGERGRKQDMGMCSRFKMGIERSFNARVAGRETLVPSLSKLTHGKKAFPVVNRISPLKQGVNISFRGSRDFKIMT